MLHKGDVVKGPLWPEIVEIKESCTLLNGAYEVEACGLSSEKYYNMVVLEQQLPFIEKLNDTYTGQDLDTEQLQAYLSYWEIDIDRKFSKSRALGNQKVIPLPHQIEAVYGRMLQTPTVRYLLADDPGAGKTIMAGMLIRELKARKSAERILILVPPLVLKQWQEELHEKFQEEFVILNRAAMQGQNGNPFIENTCILASLYWASRDEVKTVILEADFDLVIIDEAHKMAAYTTSGKKKTTRRTKIYKLGESLLQHTEHCLLLTATPHKGDVENFRHLMRLIDPDIFSSIGIKETLRDKANPFIIRRLKENLKNFDGSPLFPKRTTQTIQYELSQQELLLYEQVTAYVKNHFNRAMIRKKHGTAFAMMLLQRRLSSSIEAIHCSLQRRAERLTLILNSEMDHQEINHDDYDELAYDEQEQFEEASEDAVDTVDRNELRAEIAELESLLNLSAHIRNHHTERKFQELEKALFGEKGLLARNEKILIFTESTDTLLYLERKFTEYGLETAKIMGRYSMEERRRQVELFRDDYPVMLATDAGGESINLQFCNQMINYDIPWNPNKLEQRMGRIHRIGQRNEVFVFNLVAKNTREGDVLITLLTKMESMKKDLGNDFVYDFIGDRLEDSYTDLPTLMQDAILNRESLTEIKGTIDKAVNEEFAEMMKQADEERIGLESVDLLQLQREQTQVAINRIPNRVYARFTNSILSEYRVRIHELQEGGVYRVERIPRSLREFARTHRVPLREKDEGYRFTSRKQLATSEQPLIENDHPLLELSIKKQTEKMISHPVFKYTISLPVPEELFVESFVIGFADGTGRQLRQDVVYFARRSNGDIIEIDSYWLFSQPFGNVSLNNELKQNSLIESALRKTIAVRESLGLGIESQLNKKRQFLRRAFNNQYNQTMERLEKYKKENTDNRNSVLINQMKAQLLDIEDRRRQRLEEIERERSINILSPSLKGQFLLTPSITPSYRVINEDYRKIVSDFEQQNGRKIIEYFTSLAMIDFMSEDSEGNRRFIILMTESDAYLSEDHLRDLEELQGYTWIYVINEFKIVEKYLGDNIGSSR